MGRALPRPRQRRR